MISTAANSQFRIVNMRNKPIPLLPGEILVRVDRASILGNPFHSHGESQRNAVCDKYCIHFAARVAEGANTPFFKELLRIKDISRTNKVALACWCAPKRCHSETIKAFLEKMP